MVNNEASNNNDKTYIANNFDINTMIMDEPLCEVEFADGVSESPSL